MIVYDPKDGAPRLISPAPSESEQKITSENVNESSHPDFAAAEGIAALYLDPDSPHVATVQMDATLASAYLALRARLAEVERVAKYESDVAEQLSAELATLREDKARLDWLDREEQRVDRVATVCVKRYYDRDGIEWANVAGPIREALDAARASEGRRDG